MESTLQPPPATGRSTAAPIVRRGRIRHNGSRTVTSEDRCTQVSSTARVSVEVATPRVEINPQADSLRSPLDHARRHTKPPFWRGRLHARTHSDSGPAPPETPKHLVFIDNTLATAVPLQFHGIPMPKEHCKNSAVYGRLKTIGARESVSNCYRRATVRCSSKRYVAPFFTRASRQLFVS